MPSTHPSITPILVFDGDSVEFFAEGQLFRSRLDAFGGNPDQFRQFDHGIRRVFRNQPKNFVPSFLPGFLPSFPEVAWGVFFVSTRVFTETGLAFSKLNQSKLNFRSPFAAEGWLQAGLT